MADLQKGLFYQNDDMIHEKETISSKHSGFPETGNDFLTGTIPL